MKKIRVAVIYGGRSGEHEISLRSAASVIAQLDRSKFEIVPIGIDKQGRWRFHDLSLIENQGPVLPLLDTQPEILLAARPSEGGGANLVPSSPGRAPAGPMALGQAIDVVFPAVHGPLCEDGTLQGLLELADVPYVGSGVLGSAVAMDKDVAKRLLASAGLPVVPWITVRAGAAAVAGLAERVGRELGYPCFVKPANLGSSVGVHKVRDAAGLAPALADALRYDAKVLIERAIDAREIEIAVLEAARAGDPPLTSVAGEINPKHEFYSYEAKYLDEDGAELVIPARLDATQLAEAQRLAREGFVALELEGMARLDLFLDRRDGKFYVNEANTIPGFTSISMYPKMWEASGLAYRDLLTRLVELALARHARRARLVRDFHGE